VTDKAVVEGTIPLRERRSLSEEWSEFARLVIPDGASAMQVTEMRRAWYAGAASIFDLISGGLDEDHEPTDLDVAYLESLHQELKGFARDLQRGSA
jgi:hypothetical protein